MSAGKYSKLNKHSWVISNINEFSPLKLVMCCTKYRKLNKHSRANITHRNTANMANVASIVKCVNTATVPTVPTMRTGTIRLTIILTEKIMITCLETVLITVFIIDIKHRHYGNILEYIELYILELSNIPQFS